MTPGSSDLVDCRRLAADAAVIERVIELASLPRLRDELAEPRGSVHATFAFTRLSGARAGAKVTVRAEPILVCQRCMQGFAFPVAGGSEVEFETADAAQQSDAVREPYPMQDGLVRLSDLAEEELLLALPIAPMCAIPDRCGNAPSYAGGAEPGDRGLRRPFGGLQDLLKKT